MKIKNTYKLIIACIAALGIVGCDSGSKNIRSLGSNNSSANVNSEIISSESVKDSNFLSLSEKAVKRYKPINLVAKITSRTLDVNIAEYEWNTRIKKSTGTLSFLGTNAVSTNSKPVDGVSLAWFKEVRQYVGAKCNAFVNRESGSIKEDNLLIKSMNIPTEADLNTLPVKALRLNGVDDSIHEITKLYAPVFNQRAEKLGMDPGNGEFLNAMKSTYRLYCIAVLTDPLVIFY